MCDFNDAIFTKKETESLEGEFRTTEMCIIILMK